METQPWDCGASTDPVPVVADARAPAASPAPTIYFSPPAPLIRFDEYEIPPTQPSPPSAKKLEEDIPPTQPSPPSAQKLFEQSPVPIEAAASPGATSAATSQLPKHIAHDMPPPAVTPNKASKRALPATPDGVKHIPAPEPVESKAEAPEAELVEDSPMGKESSTALTPELLRNQDLSLASLPVVV